MSLLGSMSESKDIFLNMGVLGIRNCTGYTARGDDQENMVRCFRKVHYSHGIM